MEDWKKRVMGTDEKAAAALPLVTEMKGKLCKVFREAERAWR